MKAEQIEDFPTGAALISRLQIAHRSQIGFTDVLMEVAALEERTVQTEAIRQTIPCPTCGGERVRKLAAPIPSPSPCLHCQQPITRHRNGGWFHAGGWHLCSQGVSSNRATPSPTTHEELCPDCTDGKISHARAWAIAAAVFSDDFLASKFNPTDEVREIIATLRAVKSC